jgi:predicted PurR-regulated permease PerM
MFNKIKNIIKTEYKLIIALIVALIIDITMIFYAYKNSYTAIIISIIILSLIIILTSRIVSSLNKQNNISFNDVNDIMTKLLTHLNNSNDNFLRVSTKLYKILPINSNYFYFRSPNTGTQYKIQVILDTKLKNFDFKTNNNSPYINSVNDIYK